MNLYCTADRIGAETGGGLVTKHESEALAELGPCEVWGRQELGPVAEEPWGWDQKASRVFSDYWCKSVKLTSDEQGFQFKRVASKVELAHLYAGVFGRTVGNLKAHGCKVAYTIAAHDREVSRREHEQLGLPFPYPHLTEEGLWQRYIEGYRRADVIVCPGAVAAATVRNYGPEFRDKRIEIIPHGCYLPARVTELPDRFTVGYLGSFGADKGVRYLLEAWQKLNYKDAVLVLGGADSQTPWADHLIQRFAPSVGPILQLGWVKNVSVFYSGLSLYVQPSATEGFGIEVVEAMAHGRPVLCSDGAGAADCVPPWYEVKACDADDLASKIDQVRQRSGCVGHGYPDWSAWAAKYTWDKVRAQYQSLWRSLL